jgi:catechol 2,3-dioxygenase-like lactoylglutathione lyase family enzyme
MLASHTPHVVVGVSDIDRARQFYEGVLGFAGGVSMPGGLLYEVGDGTVLVYQTEHAGTGKATVFGFELSEDDFDAEVAQLRTAGVDFTSFDMDGLTWDDGVGHMGSAKAAWFSDPDGNAISMSSGIRDLA